MVVVVVDVMMDVYHVYHLCRNMMVSGLQEIDRQRAYVQDVQIPLDMFE